jgi:hypothetical protein
MTMKGWKSAVIFCVLHSTEVCSKIVPPTTCRPPLPVDWYIARHQGFSGFSQQARYNINVASLELASFVNQTISDIPGIDASSLIVAGPWGKVFEQNLGKLRSNDTSDTRIVNGDSIYRIASVSKV